MLSSSLRTMATCSGLPAISSSTWRRDSSAAPRSAEESSDQAGDGGQPVDQGGAGLGERHGRHVVGHPGPQADHRHRRSPEAELEGRLHAGRHLELALDDAHPVDQLGRGSAGRWRPASPGGCGGRGRGRRRGRPPCGRRSRGPAPTTASTNPRQWKSGSGPTRKSTSAPARSWPCASGSGARSSSVVTPLTMRTTGRRARWSKKWSPSKVTSGLGRGVGQEGGDRGGRPEPGVHPALERHHQHRRVQRRLRSGPRSRRGRRPAGLTARPAVSAASCGQSADLARGTRRRCLVSPGPGPGQVAGVDALEDAGQLPVAEGHVVGDVARRRGPRPRRSGRASPRAGRTRRRSPAAARAGPAVVVGVGPIAPSAGRRRPWGRPGCRSPSPRWPGHLAVVVEDDVVEPVVAVDDGRRPAGRGSGRPGPSPTRSTSPPWSTPGDRPSAVLLGPAASWRSM